ncbi:2'-5' RNA ligase family protein [Sphingomonas sp.]|uniref:2'-5' RNA ligase family protein n=1 Tax=Sphingomonas sp. TaxID=28214 RepID=UPI003B3B8F3D
MPGLPRLRRPALPDTAPLIVSALFGAADFAWLDGLRRAHFPPERNQLSAHLTLFHHLPPSVEEELKHRLSEAARRPRPKAEAIGVMNLGRGVAIRISSPDLSAIREDLAQAFASLLTPQDAVGWRPHVTIQNKVGAPEAKALHAALESGFRQCFVQIDGLAAWRYRGGPWEPLSRHMFRG